MSSFAVSMRRGWMVRRGWRGGDGEGDGEGGEAGLREERTSTADMPSLPSALSPPRLLLALLLTLNRKPTRLGARRTRSDHSHRSAASLASWRRARTGSCVESELEKAMEGLIAGAGTEKPGRRRWSKTSAEYCGLGPGGGALMLLAMPPSPLSLSLSPTH